MKADGKLPNLKPEQLRRWSSDQNEQAVMKTERCPVWATGNGWLADCKEMKFR